MVRHIILWKIRETFSDGEKAVIRENAKRELEGLRGRIEGLQSVSVETRALPSSTADLMLTVELEDEAALAAYRDSPIHNAAADRYVRPYMAVRLCLDYEAE